ncbi:MAG: glutaredoxin family protein [Candidatus Dadabacteria bacterium]|nr:MAG: glutaredoxin family protein [Candidatus Dadabacteria bacterium]
MNRILLLLSAFLYMRLSVAQPSDVRSHTVLAGNQVRVEIFVTSWCPYCRRLEKFLTSEKIAYVRYDIEHDPKGRKIYDSIGGRGVPVIRIGQTVLFGFNPVEIKEALRLSGKQKNMGLGTISSDADIADESFRKVS